MPNRTDLASLEECNRHPAEHRLRALIASRLAGEDHEERVAALAKAGGYLRPSSIRLWTNFTTPVPMRMLPKLAMAFDIDLGVLTALWVGEHASADDPNGDIAYSVTPQYTSDELNLIEVAREIYAEENLIDDLESGKVAD